MAQINYSIYWPLGVLPSLIWLLFYLREDVRPEPKKMIIFIFLFGMLMSFPTFLLECLPVGLNEKGGVICLFSDLFSRIFRKPFSSLFYFILIVGLIEEVAKYLPVKFFVLKSKELDEPVDLIIYMIVAGLGFAAVENILLAFSKSEHYFSILVGRFLSATFLHALCSGILGYFLAISFFDPRKKKFFLPAGLFFVTILHGFYDFTIMETEGNVRILTLASILFFLAIFLKIFFQRSKKLKSVCKV